MKGKLPTWALLMILASLALTNTNSSFNVEHHQGDVNLSRPSIQGQETIHGAVDSGTLNGSDKEQEDLAVTGKGQRGKGVSGGGGAASRSKNGAAARRPYLIEKTMLHVSFSLVLPIFFKLL